jgi:hypothetical protein
MILQVYLNECPPESGLAKKVIKSKKAKRNAIIQASRKGYKV